MFKKDNLAIIFASVALATSVGVLFYERKYAKDLEYASRLIEKVADTIDFAEIIRDF